MQFNSLAYLIFLPCFVVIYWMLRGNVRIAWCLAGSYLFYGYWNQKLLALIVISTLVDYCIALALERQQNERRRRALLGLSLVTNLGILGTFKYLNFFADSLQQLVQPLGWEFHWTTIQIVLPAGISFYTFQTLSYTIDVYRRKIKAQRDLLRFATFVCFFPQLIAGPIVRASELLPQLMTDQRLSWHRFESGMVRIVVGFFKKLVIADTIAVSADLLYAHPEGYSSLNTVVLVFLYSFQVYCDFSGYSDIAIGSARLLGIELPENFRFPYLATSPSEFWRRWHITLSQWLRDYVYIPLGGSRCGLIRTCINLSITMLLCGLWHGASWNCVLWGAIHGALVAGNHCLRRVRLHAKTDDEPAHASPASPSSAGWGIGQWIVKGCQCAAMFVVVSLSWVLFRASDLGQAVEIFGNLVSFQGLSVSTLQNRIPLLQACGLTCLFAGAECLYQIATVQRCLAAWSWLRWSILTVMLWIMALLGTFSGNTFTYFQF